MTNVVGTAIIKILPDPTAFTAAMSKMGAVAKGALGPATAAMSGFQTAQAKAAAGLGNLQTGLRNAGTSAGTLGRNLTGVTVLAGAFAAVGLKAAYDFDTSMRRVGAITAATGEEFDKLDALAQKLGRDTEFTAGQAADGMANLALAGFSVTEIMDSVGGTLRLASAGGIGLAEATTIAANALRAYQFEAKEIGRVNDVLASTFTNTNTNISQLAEAFKYVAPVAAVSGLEFEQVTAALGLMANAGFQGSYGGTALRTAIAKLEKPTKAGADVLEKLGVQTHNMQGELLPLVDILRQFEEANLGTADAMALFGVRAGPGFLALLGQGTKKLEELTVTNRRAGNEIKIVGDNLKLTKAEMKAMSDAFDITAPIVTDLGFSLDETSGALGIMIDKGASAAEAGGILTRALKATKNDAILPLIDASRDLNGNLVNSDGEILGLTEVLAILQSRGLTSEEALSALGDGAGDLATLAGLSAKEMAKLSEEMRNGGRAADIAREQMEGIKGGLLRLKSSVEAIAILAFGGKDGLINKLGDAADALALFLNKIMETRPLLIKIPVYALMAAGAFGVLARVAEFLFRGLSALVGVLKWFVLNPIWIGIALFAGVLVGAYTQSEKFREAVGGLVEALSGLWSVIADLFSPAVDDAGKKMEGAGDKSNGFLDTLENIGNVMATVVDAISTVVGWLQMFIEWIGESQVRVSLFLGSFAGIAVIAIRFLVLARNVGFLAAAMGVLTSPATLVVAAVVGIATAFYFAYTRIQPFRDAVDGVIDSISGVFSEVVDSITAFVNAFTSGSDEITSSGMAGFFERLGTAARNVTDQLGNLWDVLRGGDDVAQGVGEIIDNIFGDTGVLDGPIRDMTTALLEFWQVIKDVGGTLFNFSIQPVIDSFRVMGELLTGDFSGAWDIAGEGLSNFRDAAVELPGKLIELLGGLASTVSVALEEGGKIGMSILDGVVESFQNVPVVGPLVEALRSALGDVTKSLAGVFNIVGGILNWDGAQISEGVGQMASAIWNELTVSIPLALSGLTELFSEILPPALEGMVKSIKDIPILGEIGGFVLEAIRGGFQIAGGIGDVLGGLLTFDMGRVLDGLGGIATGIATWVTELPGKITGLIGDSFGITAVILEWIGNGIGGISDSIRDIPILGDMGSLVLDAIKSGFDAVGGLAEVFQGLFTFDFGKIKDGLGGIVGAIGDFLISLPSQIITYVGNIGEILGNVIRGAADWVVENAPGFFKGLANLPEIIGKLVKQAFGSIGDLIGSLFGGGGEVEKKAKGKGGGGGKGGDEKDNPVVGFFKGLFESAKTWLTEKAGPTIGEAVSEFVKKLPSTLGNIFGGIIDIAKVIGPGLYMVFKDWLGDLGGLLWSLIKGAFNFVVDNGPAILAVLGNFIAGVPGQIISLLGNLGGLLWDAFKYAFEWVVENGPGILAGIGEWLGGLPGKIIGFLGDFGSTIVDWFTGGTNAVGENEGGVLSGIGTWLSELPGKLLGFLGDLGSTLLGWVGSAFSWIVENGPGIIVDVVSWFATLPIKLIGSLLNFGIDLLAWVANAFYWVVTEGPGALTDLLAWFAGLPATIIGAIVGFGEKLWEWAKAGFQWVVDNGADVLLAVTEWVAGVPGMLIGGMVSFGQQLWDWAKGAFKWIVDNGGDILVAVLEWVTGVPGQFITAMASFGQQLWDWAKAAFEWIVTNGADILTSVLGWAAGVPGQIISAAAALGQQLWDWAKAGFGWVVTNGADVLAAIGSWAAGVPGKIIGFLGDLGGKVFDWVKGAFNTVKDRGPEVIANAVEFFKSIPGKLLDAITTGIGAVGGVVSDIGGKIWNNIKKTLAGVFDDIRGKEVKIGPLKFTPFSFLPELAEGAIITKRTEAVLGEAGAEVVIPLTKPERAKELVVQSGLLNIIQETPVAVGAAVPTTPSSLPVPSLPNVSGLSAAGATLEVPPVNVPAGLAVSAPPATVDTAPVSAAASTAMTQVVSAATGALAPLTDWFATFPAKAAAALLPFGPTVWAAVAPSFQFFVDSALAVFNSLLLFLMQFTPQAIVILTPFGPVLWAAMAPGLQALDTAIRAFFGGISTFLSTWQDGVKAGLSGLPAWAGGIATQIANALKAPFANFASATWNPFATAMNTALNQIPATASINIPMLPTAHSGGVVGERLPETGGPLTREETIVRMKLGEGVLPTETMEKMSPQQFETLRAGNFSRFADGVMAGASSSTEKMSSAEIVGKFEQAENLPMFGERDPRVPETGDGVPYSPTPAENNFATIPPSVMAAFDGVIAGLAGGLSALREAPLYTAKYLGELGSVAIPEGQKFAAAKVSEANAKAMASVGADASAFPGGVPADLPAAIELVRQWRGRVGSYKAILAYFDATGVPGRAVSTIRPGAVTRGSGGKRQSNHAIARAVDFAGMRPSRDSPELLRIYNAFGPVAGLLAERIYSGPGGGFVRNPITRADHHDHVHIGLAEGAVLRGAVDALIGEAGPEVRVPLSNVGALGAYLRSGSISAPVIDTPTFVKLGVTPEVVLPLSRPDRARDLARNALAATPAGQTALSKMGTAVMGEGAIFTPRSEPRRISKVEDITPPDNFLRMWMVMKSVAPQLARAGVNLGTRDLVLGDGRNGSIGGGTPEAHLKAMRVLMDAGFSWKVFEDLSGRFTRGDTVVRFDNPFEERPMRQPFWMADNLNVALLNRLGDAQRFFDIDLSAYTGKGGLPDFVGAFNTLPSFLQEAIMAAQVAAPTPDLDVSKTLTNIARFADGGIFSSPTYGLMGEAGDEVLIPLERPQRALALADQSGLLDVLEAARQQNTQTRTAEAPAAPGAQVPFDGGPLGGGPGNTYNITGISLDQVIAEIEARDEATLRKRR